MAYDNNNRNRRDKRENRGRNDNRNNRGNNKEEKPFDYSTFDANYKKWIQEEIDDECITFMEKFGLFLCHKENFKNKNGVTTTQMRNVFSEVKRIGVKLSNDEQWKSEYANILLLRPKIAYNTARVLSNNQKSRITDLRKVLENFLLVVKNKEHFGRFSQIFEGIIAYHKVYGGRD